MSATVHPIDPLLARGPRERVVDSKRAIAKFNANQARIEAQTRRDLNATARVRGIIDRNLREVALYRPRELSHVHVHPSAQAKQQTLPYDCANDSRIPDAIRLPLETLLRGYEAPFTIPADTLLEAVRMIRAYDNPKGAA